MKAKKNQRKKKKAISFRLRDPIFGQDFIVVLDTTDAVELIYHANKHLRKIDGSKTSVGNLQEWLDKHSGGVLEIGPHIIIWFSMARPGGGLVAHESLHACRLTFSNRAVPFDANNDETIAYYLDWIVRSINSQL